MASFPTINTDAGLSFSTSSPHTTTSGSASVNASSKISSTHGHGLLIGLLVTTAQHQNIGIAPTRSPNNTTSTTNSSAELNSVSSKTISHKTFKDPDVNEYLDSLTAQSLTSLLQEPARLASEMNEINYQLSELAYNEYKSFLASSICEEDLLNGLDTLQQSISKLESQFPLLESSCDTFQENASNNILPSKAMYSNLLNQHSKIMDLLEIPQLAETFVRSGYYEEAMDLYTYAARLTSRHSNSRLIKAISEEVEGIKKTMVAQLVRVLATNVKLPLCIRVVGYLRRLSVYSEAELRILFLQQRDAFLKITMHELSAERDSGEYLRRYIEISREYFFDIIAQYRAIFSDSSSFSSPASIPSFASPSSPFMSAASSQSEILAHTTSILSSYAAHAIGNLIIVIRTQLNGINDTSRLSSLLTQCMYYGMSLGRVGIDFRMVIGRLFEDAVMRIVRDEIHSGVERFERIVIESGEKGLSVKTLSNDNNNTSYSWTGTNTTLKTSTPPSLLTHPPLAQLINSVFSSYNQLRLLAPLSLSKPIAQLLTESLIICAGVLSKLGDERQSKWSIEERNTHHLVCKAFIDGVVLPAKAGLELIYKNKAGNCIQVEIVIKRLGSWSKNQIQDKPNIISESSDAGSSTALKIDTNGQEQSPKDEA